ncbi:MAG: dCMP deaminase family protein [Puniceicoccales bacterium]|jgi:dCMP deaminase|nr:dCMP deaminase family protein [Puniceicoccales bacterium]
MDAAGTLPEILTEQLNRLTCRPSWEEYFLSVALLIAARSPCSRQHVGCILVSAGEQGNRIIASGYNGFLPGLSHTSRIRDGHELGTVHAEQNAIGDAARRGVSISGSSAYVTHYPCIHCAKILIAAGVQKIVYHWDYDNDPLVDELFHEATVAVRKI